MLGVRPAAKHLECTLQKCRDEKILSCFLHSYQYLQCDGFKSHPSLQRALLCTFTDFGSMHCARHRFERIAHSHHSCMGNPHINSDTNYASLRTREKDTRERVREFRALWAHYCEKAQMFQNTIKCNAMLFYLFS